MIKRCMTFMLQHRYAVVSIIGAVTVFFAWGMTKVEVKTIFNDLLPQSHPYIQTHLEYQEQLGDPLKVFLMLRVREGDIYRRTTLEKVKRITDRLDFIKGVNHNQIYSIASRKVKKVTVASNAIYTEDLLKKMPQTDEELESFKMTVRNTRDVFGIWVSRDEKSVLFTAGFIPELVDFNGLFRTVKEIVQTESDENHVIYAAGEPILTGWVYSYQKEMLLIFAITVVTLVLLLYSYFRNLAGVIVPLVSTTLSAVWGLGFCGLVGFNLEPLTLVIPLLITARALSHSVQITERYFELYEEQKEVIPACIDCGASILPPGLLGIATDAIGILLIAVAPIPMMQKLAYICAFWANSIIVTGLVFTPVFISFFTPPRNISTIVDTDRGLTQKILGGIAKIGYGKAGIVSFVVAIGLFVSTGWISTKVDIGDINPGTPILWQDSDYNIAIGEVNRYFPGTEELYIIVQGAGDRAVEEPKMLKLLDTFQQHMERSPLVARTLSVADFLPNIHKNVFGGFPKREILPETLTDSAQIYYFLTGGAAPGDYDRYFSEDRRDANVIIWYKDHMGATLRDAMAWVKTFVEERQELIADTQVTFRLASGNIGMLAAINETVKGSQLLNFILVMGSVFVLCSLTYRSFVAAIILMIPLNLANLITMSIMKGLGIGLNINTLPVVSVGVGVGIDYGIYLLSRLVEEYQSLGGYSLVTPTRAIKTTGKAIFFTATTMIAGVIFWYFFSNLRFQAEMGLLLALIMFINMIGALILIPSLVYVFKPKFLGRSTLLIKE